MGRRAPTTKRTRRPLQPVTPIILVKGNRLKYLSPDEVTTACVGQKAVGLTSIPTSWTRPFFVVCGIKTPTSKALSTALIESGIPSGAKILVRSSGVDESIERRGEHPSVECVQDELSDQIRRLKAVITSGATVHWVVQELVRCVEKGQLANERRIAKDKRDWVVEVETTASHSGEIYRIPLRTWRDNRPPLETLLGCTHRESIVNSLAMVARWTYERLIRVHYEWVWDGKAVHIVQADPCDFVERGRDPHSLVNELSCTTPIADTLEVFRLAEAKDFEAYRKLANVRVYSQLGYQIVPFFVLDNRLEIQSIIRDGRCSDALQRDLKQLASRPLVMRTDGQNTPKHLREMLPRSDELRSAQAAEQWLIGEFSKKVNTRLNDGECLADSSLCLIAHHFVPAAAAAWCQALPNQRRVRIESLWGIPEGLYGSW